jgi:hypothetical protein
MASARPVTLGRAVLIMTVAQITFWSIALGVVAFGLALPVRHMAIPWFLMSTSSLVMSFVICWARSLLNEPPGPATPRRFAFAMLALVDVQLTALLWSAVLLGLVSREAALRDYMPVLLLLSIAMPLVGYLLARRRIAAA